MTKPAKLLLCALALGFAALASWTALRASSHDDRAEVAVIPAAGSARESDEEPDVAPAAAPSPRDNSQLVQREPLAREPSAPPPTDTAPRDDFDLLVRVLDERDTPLVGAKLRLVGPGGLCIAGATDESGELVFPHLPAGDFELLARKTGHRTHFARVELRGAPREERLELRLARLPVLAVHVRTKVGESYLAALEADADTIRRSLLKSILAVATAEAPPVLLPVELGGYEREFGIGAWLAKSGPGDLVGELRVEAESAFHVSLVLGRQVIAAQRVELGQEAVVFELDPSTVVATLAGVRGRCVDAAGAPMAGIPVNVSNSSMTRIVHSKQDGTFEAGALKPTPVRLYAQGKPLGEFELRGGETLDLGDIELGGSGEPSVTVNGAVIVHIGETGDAHEQTKWRVARVEAGGELQPAKAEHWRKLESGTHTIFELEPGSYAVGTSGPADATSASRGPDAVPSSGSIGGGARRAEPTPACARYTPFELTNGPTAEVSLRLEPTSKLVLEPAGVASIGTRYRVRDETTGLVNRSGALVRDESLALILPRGAWRLELELPGGARHVETLVLGLETRHVALPR